MCKRVVFSLNFVLHSRLLRAQCEGHAGGQLEQVHRDNPPGFFSLTAVSEISEKKRASLHPEEKVHHSV